MRGGGLVAKRGAEPRKLVDGGGLKRDGNGARRKVRQPLPGGRMHGS